MGKRWGNALGGYKKQRRDKKGRFAKKRGGAIGRAYRQGKSLDKAYKKKTKAAKAKKRAARKPLVRDRRTAGVVAQVAVSAAGIYATKRAFQGKGSSRGAGLTLSQRRNMDRLSAMQRQTSYLDHQINAALAGTGSPIRGIVAQSRKPVAMPNPRAVRAQAARKAGVAPMTGWNPGYKNGGKFRY